MSVICRSPLLFLLCAAACHRPSARFGACTAGEAITISVVELPTTLDWSHGNESSWSNYPAILAMMEGLARLDEHDQPVPDLAESWDVAGNVYTFHLRKDVLWSDGKTPLTAKDFVFGWKRALAGEQKDELSDLAGAAAIYELAGEGKPIDAALGQVGVEAVDDHTLRVTLASPRSYYLSRSAQVYTHFPSPSKDLEGKSEEEIRRYFDEPKDGRPLVVGPFRVTSWDRVSKRVELEQNPYYWGKRPEGAVKQISLIHADLADTLYDQCKIDFYLLDDPTLLMRLPGDAVREQLMSVYWLGLNTARLDENLRKAIAYAIDRKKVTAGLIPDARPAFGMLPEGVSFPGAVSPGDPGTEDLPRYDPGKAKEYLKRSTYKGEELTLLVKSQGFLPETGLADAVRDELGAVGIKVRLRTTADFTDDIKEPGPDGAVRVDMSLRRAGADYAHPETFMSFFQTGGTHYTMWHKLDGGQGLADLEALLTQGAAAQDPAEQRRIYLEAQKLLLARYAVIVPLFYPDRYYRRRAGLEGLGIDPFNFLTFRSARIGR